MSKSQILVTILFGEPLERFSPGIVTRKDIFRVFLCLVDGAASVSKKKRLELIGEVATSLVLHWECPDQDPKSDVYQRYLKCAKSAVTKVVNRGWDLKRKGGMLGTKYEEKLLREERQWFSVSVTLKSPKVEDVTLVEVNTQKFVSLSKEIARVESHKYV